MSTTVSRAVARRDDGSRSHGPLEKAAIIMLALDEERSQRLFAELDEDAIRRVSHAMARLGRMPMELIEQTVGEFREEVGRTGNVLGTAEGTERILLRIMPPEKVAEIMGGIKGSDSGAVWDRLANIPIPTLVNYLRDESPQAVAMILGRVPPQHAARAMASLPEPLADEVALRMVRMESIHNSVLADIEQTLERELVGSLGGTTGHDSTSVLAELLDCSDRALVARVLATLEEAEPEAAARIRKTMFTFDDLVRVDPATLGVLISECAVEKLAVALSAATPAIRELFLSGMSERAANMLRDEIETMPTPRKKAVEDAQAEIIQLTKRLAEEGRIFLLEHGEESSDAA
ncbi:MAG: flagellar motor switch protein FliG [Acetobacteraceae bacterium]|jgi:flagellar motor switch protein FliG